MPSLRERLPTWLGGRKATAAISFHPPTAMYYGTGIGRQPSHQTLLAENLNTAATATRAIANRISSLIPQVKVSRRDVMGTLEDEILDDHPLQVLLNRPHPNYSRSQMLYLLGNYIVTVGEAYLLKVDNGLAVPTELHPIPPWMIVPRMSGGVVESYGVMDGDGKWSIIKADTVVRFFTPDPESPWTAEGYLGPAGLSVDAQKFVLEHLRSHYQNDATPKTALEAGEAAELFQPADKERFYTEWKRQYHQRRGSQQGVPAILPTGYKLIELMAQSGADVTPLLEHWRDDVLMAFGTPRSILGQVVSGDRSSAETNQYVFDKHTVFPIATMIADAFTLQLAPDFDPSIFVEFEPFVSEDKRFLLEKQTADLTGKVRSINQVREDDGLDPVDWGEEPVGKLGEVPYDPNSYEMPGIADGAIADEEPEPPTEGEPFDEEEERNRGNGSALFFDPRAEWDRVVQREKKYMPPMSRAMRIIFRKQRDDVLKKLDALTPRARVTADELFDPEDQRWAKLFKLMVEPTREDAFLEIISETLSGFGIEEFVFTDVLRQKLIEHGAELVKHANRTTQKAIQRGITRALLEGADAGEGIDQIAKRIQKNTRREFAIRSKQASTIARTEVGRAASSAHIEGYKIAGVEEQRWNTSMDDAVRDTHKEMESVTTPVGVPFTIPSVAGIPAEMSDGPRLGAGGVPLSAANSINCRCFLTPVTK